MSYLEWLERYVELSGPYRGKWTDPSWFERFVQMVRRAEARLVDQDHGEFVPSVAPTVSMTDDPAAVVARLGKLYPRATDLVHPSDAAWFLELAKTPGKPVNFVPVIDQDVRRWWRSDSLWQSQDERYDADQVAIIPGISAVAGITRVNEPVEELLARFNDAAIDLLLERGVELTDAFPDPVPMVLAASGTYWAGRHQPSVIARLGDVDAWELREDPEEYTSAYHPPTGRRWWPAMGSSRC